MALKKQATDRPTLQIHLIRVLPLETVSSRFRNIESVPPALLLRDEEAAAGRLLNGALAARPT
jgi:hypothetical protein